MTLNTEIILNKKEKLSIEYSDPSITTKPENLLGIMLHGFPAGHKAAHNDLFGDAQSILTDRGYHSIRFDFRGCGESSGEAESFSLSSAYEDLDTIYSWAKEKGYKDIFFIAEGLGASISALHPHAKTKACIWLWPILDLKGWVKASLGTNFQKDDLKKQSYIENDGIKWGTRLINELQSASMAQHLNDHYASTLIMHGKRDEKISLSGLPLAREHVRAPRLDITVFEDGEHGLHQSSHRKMLFHHMNDFLEKYLK